MAGRCKVIASFEFFQSAHLRFAHALDVNVLSQPYVGVPQNPLNRLIVNAKLVKVCCEAAAEGMPAVPARKGIIALKEMRFRLVLRFCFLADRTAR